MELGLPLVTHWRTPELEGLSDKRVLILQMGKDSPEGMGSAPGLTLSEKQSPGWKPGLARLAHCFLLRLDSVHRRLTEERSGRITDSLCLMRGSLTSLDRVPKGWSWEVRRRQSSQIIPLRAP